MSNYSKKISELVSTGKVPESAVLPVALAGQTNETYRVSLNDIRANLLFENAYSSIANGISNTVKGEVFYVYTDDTKLYAAAFTNVNGSTATAIYKDGIPVIYGTGKLMASGQFGSYTSYVSYLYSEGSASGGEKEIALPFDCFDVVEVFINGSHQIKNFSFEFDRESNKVSLAKTLVKGDVVVLYVRPYPGTAVTPIEPGITDYVNVAWLYNDGAAVGGEASLTPPWSFTTVPAIYINGSKQVLNKHYEVDTANKKINLAKALNENDIVEVILGGSRAQIVVDVSGTPAEVLATLALSGGASKINTSFGSTLEQFVQSWHGIISFDALRARRPNYEGERVRLRGYYDDGLVGQGDFIGHLGNGTDDGGMTAAGDGYYWSRVEQLDIAPEFFGAKGNGVDDDSAAIQRAFNYVRNKAMCRINGLGFYRLTKTILIYGYGKGLNSYLRAVIADSASFEYTGWKTAKALFQIGTPSSTGSMVGLMMAFDWVDCANVVDAIQVTAYGCGGSHFHIERMVNAVNGVTTPDVIWPSSSNMITGGYWNAGLGQGVRLGKIASGNTYTNEGWIIDVNFITGFNLGGVYITNGAMYTNIRGQTDFNGRWLSRVSFASSTGNNAGDTVTFNGVQYEVIAAYQKVAGLFSLLINEGKNVSSSGSIFNVGDTVTTSNGDLAVTAVYTPSTNNWYPDVIHDFYNSAGIAKCNINMPYCGGVEGSYLFSSDIWVGNSNVSRSRQTNGNAFVHSGTVATWYDTYLNKQILDASDSYLAPYRHLYMRTNRIYGTEIYMAFAKSTSRTVRTFAKVGDGTVTSVREKWILEYTGTLLGVYGKYEVFVGTSSIELVKLYGDNIVTLSVSGMSVMGIQGAQDTLITTFNAQRIF